MRRWSAFVALLSALALTLTPLPAWANADDGDDNQTSQHAQTTPEPSPTPSDTAEPSATPTPSQVETSPKAGSSTKATLDSRPEPTPQPLASPRPPSISVKSIQPAANRCVYDFKIDDDIDESLTQYLLTGQSLLEPPAPQKPHYEFLGWYTSVGEFTNWSNPCPVADNRQTVLTAKFAPANLVRFMHTVPDSDPATNDDLEVYTAKIADWSTIDAELTKARGYVYTSGTQGFDGWYTDKALTTPFDSSNPPNISATGELRLWAKTSSHYLLSYSTGGLCRHISSKYYRPGEATDAPPLASEMQCPGYDFVGWFKDSSFTQPYVGGGTISSDTVVYGKVMPKTVNYRVVYWVEKPGGGWDYNREVTLTKQAGQVANLDTITVPRGQGAPSGANVAATNKLALDGMHDGTAGYLALVTGTPYASPLAAGSSPQVLTTDGDVLVKGDGSTQLNVYFRRHVCTVTFDLADAAAKFKIGDTTYDKDSTKYKVSSRYQEYFSDRTGTWPGPDSFLDTGNGNFLESWNIGSTAFSRQNYQMTAQACGTTVSSGYRRDATATFHGGSKGTNLYLQYVKSPDQTSLASGIKRIKHDVGTGNFYFDLISKDTVSASSVEHHDRPGYCVWPRNGALGDCITNGGGGTPTDVAPDTINDVTAMRSFYFPREYTLRKYNDSSYTPLPAEQASVHSYNTSLQEDLAPLTAADKPGGAAADAVFDGWWSTPNFIDGTRYSSSETMPAHDMAAYAKWSVPKVAVKVYDAACETPLTAGSFTVEYDTSIDHGKWTELENEITSAADFDPAMSRLVGWRKKSDSLNVPFSKYAELNHTNATLNDGVYHLELCPRIVGLNPGRYSLSYDLNGGGGTLPADDNLYTGGSTARVASGQGITPPADKPGYLFQYWSQDSSCPANATRYYPGGVISVPDQRGGVAADVKLYACYVPSVPQVKLTYHLNPPSATIPNLEYSLNLRNNARETVKRLRDLSNATSQQWKAGNYIFEGWNTAADGSGTTYQPLQAVIVAADGGALNHLYAQWRSKPLQISLGSPGSALSIQKTLTGAVPTGYSEVFNFSLTEGANSQTLKTPAFTGPGSKMVDSKTLNITTAGTHTYTLREVAGSSPAINYDSHQDEVTFEVNDNEGVLELAQTKLNGNTCTACQTAFTNAVRPVSISGTKKWIDDDNAARMRPNNIVINLFRSDNPTTPFQTLALPVTSDTQNFTFSDLPWFDASGNEYTYTIGESQVPLGYTSAVAGNIITNTYNPADYKPTVGPENATIKVSSALVGNHPSTYNEPHTFKLMKGATEVATLSTPNFTSAGSAYVTPATQAVLNFDAAGTYSYVLKQVAGGSSEVNYDSAAHTVEFTVVDKGGYYAATKTTIDGVACNTNCRVKFNNRVKEVNIAGTVRWSETGTGWVRPGNLKINLYRSGTAAPIQTRNLAVDASAAQTFAFNELPKFAADGTAYTYTVRETKVPTGYSMTVDDTTYTITNTYVATPVKLVKVWDDDDDAPGKRPNSVALNLTVDGRASAHHVTLTPDNVQADGSWATTLFAGEAEINGHAVSATETLADYYVPTYSNTSEDIDADGDDDPVTTITNTYTPSPHPVVPVPAGTPRGPFDRIHGAIGDRVWNDLNRNGRLDPGEPLLAGVRVQLLSEAGEVLGSALTGSDGMYLFNNVSPGRYRLRFLAPRGFDYTRFGFNSHPDAQGYSDWIEVAAGQYVQNIDAGLMRPMPLAATGARVRMVGFSALALVFCGYLLVRFAPRRAGSRARKSNR